MTIIYKSDLSSANNLNLNGLEDEINSTNEIISAVETFISDSSSKLKGAVWEQIRLKLQNYVNVLKDRVALITDVSDSVKTANNYLLNYMGEYDVINTDYLDELLNLREVYKRNVIFLKNKIQENDLHDPSSYDKSEVLYLIGIYNYLIDSLGKKIEKINDLKMADNSSYDLLQGAINSVINYSTKVGSIKMLSVIDYLGENGV